MANTIAICRGVHRTRVTEASRLGSESAQAEANTWHTFSRTTMHADGSGAFQVTRDGRVLHRYAWGPEGAAVEADTVEADAVQTSLEGPTAWEAGEDVDDMGGLSEIERNLVLPEWEPSEEE